MTVFGNISNFQQIEGELGYFKLGEWWFTTFSQKERKYIEEKYQPFSIGGQNNRRLTKGRILSTSQTASDLLVGLVTWFKKTEDYSIAERIVNKAINLANTNDILNLHFAYQAMIEIHYRVRNIYPTALQNAIQLCELQIQIAPKAAEVFRREYPTSNLPSHKGYEQLAIIREKERNYEEVIRICRQAEFQHWTGDWGKRILRCEAKLNKLNSST